MRDEKDSQDQGSPKGNAAANPGRRKPDKSGADAAAPDAVAQAGIVTSTVPPDEPLEEIPGFLRRCAIETLTEAKDLDGVQPGDISDYETKAAMAEKQNAPADGRVAAGSPARQESFSSIRADWVAERANTGQTGNSDTLGSVPADWSNTARGALSELLADIDDEQARRVSNRDRFAALAGKRRTTWPLTALIVAFLLVVLAYSARNVDAGGQSGQVLRDALAIVVGPETGVAQATNQPVQVVTAAVQTAPALPKSVPVEEKKSKGLVFEPVNIVQPIEAGAPKRQRVASVVKTPMLRSDEPEVAPAAPARIQVRNQGPLKAKHVETAPRINVARAGSNTIALAPSAGAETPTNQRSPDKMPLAGLRIPEAELAPVGNAIKRSQMKQVASVSPGAGLPAAKMRADVSLTRAVSPVFELASRNVQPSPSQMHRIEASPVKMKSDKTRAMLVRARNLLGARDVASARLLFERAARIGSAEGAFGAAKTYDPAYFEKLGVHGVPGEPEKAAVYYQKAIDGGHAQAAEYLGQLNAWLSASQGRISSARQVK